MIRETLTAIGAAGRQALQGLGARIEVRTQISQVREWSFAMPHLGRVTVANSPVHQIYVGISQPLGQALGGTDRHEGLLEAFKQALVARIPAKRPIGTWELLEPDGATRVLRGVRSFILRQQTAAGNLYLMADVASRGEFEALRQNGWEEELASQLLPRNLGKLDSVEGPAAISRLGTYLSRFEHDIELLVPGAEGLLYTGNGVLLNQSKDGERTLLWLSLDFNKEQRLALQPGRELEGSFGAAGRVFRFRTFCAGSAALPLEGIAELPCALFEMPQRFHLDQRRRYFRVTPELPLSAQLMILPPPEGDPLASPPRAPAAAAPGVAAQIVDLSFSGVGLRLTQEPPGDLGLGCGVRLSLVGEGMPAVVELSAVVRRLSRTPQGRGRYETQLGVEFVVQRPLDQQGIQMIRQYVMAQQRQLLARRSVDV